MKLLITLVAALIVAPTGGNCQIEKRKLPAHLQVLGISPASDLISCVWKEGADVDSSSLVVLDAKSLKVTYRHQFGRQFPFEAVFLNERTIMVRLDSEIVVQFLSGSSNSHLESVCKYVKGQSLKVGPNGNSLYFIVPDPEEFVMVRLDLKNGKTDSLNLPEELTQFTDYVVLNSDTLILCLRNRFLMTSLTKPFESELRTHDGLPLKSDGGLISITSDHSGIIYANDNELFVYDLSTKKVTKIMNLHGYGSPMLSPNGTFLILSKWGSNGQVSTEVFDNFKCPHGL